MTTELQNNKNINEEENNFDLKAFLQLLWKNKWLITISALLCTIIAVFIVIRQPKIYGSQAELVILNSSGNGYTGTAIAAFADIQGMSTEVNMFNEMEIIKSPYIVDGVVKKLNLTTAYTTPAFGYEKDLYGESPISISFLDIPSDSTAQFNINKIDNNRVLISDFIYNNRPIDVEPHTIELGKTYKTPIGKIIIGGTINYSNFNDVVTVTKYSTEAMVNKISKNITTSQGPDFTSIIFLDYIDESKKRAIDILNTLIDVYNEMWINEKNRSAVNTSNFINERLAIIEQELNGIDANISDVKSSNKLPDFRSAADSYYSQSMRYDNSTFEATNQLSIAKFLREYLNDPTKKDNLIPANSGITSTSIESQIQEYNKLLIKRDNLRLNSSDSNPVIAELNNNLASMRAVIVQSIDNLIATCQIRVNEALNKERMYSNIISSVPNQAKQILSIERQQKVKENLYLYLLQKREENELTEIITVNNTRVIKQPTSLGVIAPVKSRYVLMGFAIGLIIPIAILYLINMLNTTILTKNDIVNVSIPFIGEIPLSSKRRKDNISKIRHFLKYRSRELDDEQLEIVVKDRSRSAINEAFRMVRTNLDFMISSNHESKTILLTSFNPSSGKTYITLNLATSLALKGKKVLVADFDLRRASLSKFIGNPKQGITSYLTEKNTDISKLIIKHHDKYIIDFLPVGTIAPNPVELLLTPHYEKLVDELKSQYDYILIDCPPYSLVTDTSIIARKIDMTIFIIRAGHFDKRMLPELENVYKQNRLPRMSLILNGTNIFSANSYGYGYGYGNRKHNEYYSEDELK